MVSLEEVLSDEEIRVLAQSGVVASALGSSSFNWREELKKKRRENIQLRDKDGNTYRVYDLIRVNYFNTVDTRSLLMIKYSPNSKIEEEILVFYAKNKDSTESYLVGGLIDSDYIVLMDNLIRLSKVKPYIKEGLDEFMNNSELKEDDVFAIVALIDTILRTSKYLDINNIDISYLKDSKNRELFKITEKALKVLSEIYKVNI
ncbi:MAG: hypothetical protein OH318_03015 [Candidatus Parvarchaeota archaeon]|nr:hypothetical protein [Candidatus Rehaiarchaeum fermentans]